MMRLSEWNILRIWSQWNFCFRRSLLSGLAVTWAWSLCNNVRYCLAYGSTLELIVQRWSNCQWKQTSLCATSVLNFVGNYPKMNHNAVLVVHKWTGTPFCCVPFHVEPLLRLTFLKNGTFCTVLQDIHSHGSISWSLWFFIKYSTVKYMLWTVHHVLRSLNLSGVLITQQLELKLITILQSIDTLEKLDLSDCCLSQGFGLSNELLYYRDISFVLLLTTYSTMIFQAFTK